MSEQAAMDRHTTTEEASQPIDLKPFDAALYGLVGEVVRMLAPHTEAHPMALLAHFLAEFSCIIGRRPYVELDGGQSPLSFWPVIVGKSSKARKGTAHGRIHTLFQKAVSDWTGEFSGSLSTGEGLAWAIRDGFTEDKRLYAVQSEFGSMLRLMARDGNSLSGAIRDAWDGKDLAFLVKNNPVRATRPHIVIAGHITKDELSLQLSQADRFNGFANRFTWFAVHRWQVKPRYSAPSAQTLKAITDELAQVVAWARNQDTLPLDDTALETWDDMYHAMAESLPGVVGSVLDRAEAYIRRISALYALLDRSQAVTTTHLKAAAALWSFIEASVREIFGAPGSLDAGIINTILRAVVSQGGLDDTAISALFSHRIKAVQLETAKESMRQAGYIHPIMVGTGGRPRRVWRPGRPQAA